MRRGTHWRGAACRPGARPAGDAAPAPDMPCATAAGKRRREALDKVQKPAWAGRPAMDGPDGDGGSPGTPAGGGRRQDLEKEYGRCLDRLITKSRNAASTRLWSMAKRTTIDIYACESLVPGTMEKVAKQCASASPGEVTMLPDRLGQELGDPAYVAAGPPDGDRATRHREYLKARDHLKALARNLRQEEEESGEQIGHVGFPFIEGNVDGRAVRGPMALFAASLGRKKAGDGHGWVLDIKGQHPTLNMALVKALERAMDIRLDDMGPGFDELVGRMRSGDGMAPGALFGMASAWAEGMLGIGASSRAPRAGPIRQLREADVPDPWPLHVANRMAFGKFPQADVDLEGDYRRLMKIQDDGGVVGDVLGIGRKDGAAGGGQGHGGEPHGMGGGGMDSVSAGRLCAVLPSDTDQDQVILESKSSPVTTVKGPPGTGKSQLIVNMAADAMLAGKRVMVVCQKRAALEVVHARLADAGLADCAVLMDKESDNRRSVYRQMDRAMEMACNYGAAAGATAPRREAGGLDDAISNIDRTTAELARVGEALYAPHRSGADAHMLRCTARSGYVGRQIASIDALNPTWDGLETLAKQVGRLQGGCIEYDGEDHPLCGRRSLHEATHLDTETLRKALERLAEISGGDVGRALRTRHPCGASAHDIYGMARSGHRPLGVTAIGALGLAWDELGPFAERAAQMQEGCTRYDGEDHPLRGRKSLADAQPGAEERLRDALSGLVSLSEGATVCSSHDDQKKAHRAAGAWRKTQPQWLYKRRAARSLRRLLGRRVDESEMGAEERRIRDGLEWWKRLGALGEFFTAARMNELRGLATSGDTARTGRCGKAAWESMLGALGEYGQIRAHDARKRDSPGMLLGVLEELRKRGVGGNWGDIVEQEVCLKWADDLGRECPELRGLASSGALREWASSVDAVCGFFDEQAAARLREHAASEDSGHAQWAAMLDAAGDLAQIQEHDILKSRSPPEALAVAEALRREPGADGDWGDIVVQEVCLRWVNELDKQADVLKGDPLSRYDGLRAMLGRELARQRSCVRDAIVSMAQEAARVRPKEPQSPEGMEARWGDFAQEVKRAPGRPVRVAFEEYAENFLSVAPCWLVSPEAACRVFPLKKGLFDLVIVDEASQLTVEAALPVLYRGKRVVIAGDDKQLTPHDFFQAKREDEEGGADAQVGEESLFDKARATRPPFLLSRHYRSRHRELVDFSNHAFYSGQLNVAPNVAICPESPPIRWVECDGVWINRRNEIEADRSVDIAHEAWRGAPRGRLPSIAIVTFNAEQRDAVQDEVDSRYENDEEFQGFYDRMNAGEGAEPLIVRNIENMQGDERDLVIFSVGYAHDTGGSFRFTGGPLFTKGGENRLNVAITRARESMVVVCSIHPTDIRGQYANQGPTLLRQFLEYAKATSDSNAAAQREVLDGLNGATGTAPDLRLRGQDTTLEESVARELGSQGYTVNTQVGRSGHGIDLAIVDRHDPTRYVLGIACDGAQFRTARSVKERDVLRQDFLEEWEWEVERVWSTGWQRDRTREVERIKARVEGICKGRGHSPL